MYRFFKSLSKNKLSNKNRFCCFLLLLFFVCSIFVLSYNKKIEAFVRFDSFSREKELPPLLFRRCVSLLLG